MGKQVNSKSAIILLMALLIIISGYIILVYKSIPVSSFLSVSFPSLIPTPTPTPAPATEIKALKKFSSEQEFKDYLQEGKLGYYGGSAIFETARGMDIMRETAPAPANLEKGIGAPTEAKGAVPQRVSETTVQVLGIDEPDIVKTDGKEIYFSAGKSYYWRRFAEVIPPKITGETKIIKAFPPADLSVESKIDARGDLLLHKNTLVIFSGDKIYGYNVSDPKSPQKKWTLKLEDKNYIVGARLYKGKIYLITKQRIDTYRPCPIMPLSIEGAPIEIKCADIYHPTINIPVDITYTAIVFDPDSGKREKTISFVGTSDSSIVYMSSSAIYVTYSYYEDFIKFFYNFLQEDCKDIIPNPVIEKLEKLMGYDISNAAKLTEFGIIFEGYYNSLSRDERLKIENELQNRMQDYYEEHKRELEKTGLAKIDLNKFNITAIGNVSGRPLNQFSLDEYKNYLRIATTVGGGWGMFGGLGESANDVYVLDKDLKMVGSIKDLGLGEKIYSVRFLEDKGYVVTFKQVDPFFVLDLSVPQKPGLKGELKIPGYSSYLHPITKDKILGFGKQGSKVKISLFDVKVPQKPTELDKYALDEYWSDILNTHHAFLLDKKHKIFFLPGNKGGYVFSYKDNQLELTRAVSGIRARRAIYINDYLYIIGDAQIIVLNEIDWEKVREINF